MSLKINGVTVKTPTEISEEKYKLVKEAGRTSDGTMTMDFIAKKRKINCKYSAIRGDELAVILNQIDTNTLFFPVEYEGMSGVQTITAYAGAIKGMPFRDDIDGTTIYKDVEFALIEQ